MKALALIVASLLMFLPLSARADSQHWHTGVNLAGAEFGGSKIPGRFGWDYTYPVEADLDYFVDNGLTTFRLPFRWERLQRTLGGSFDATEIAAIDAVVDYAAFLGAKVILDPHNFSGYKFTEDGVLVKYLIGSSKVPTSDFVSFWVKLANRYKNNPNVIFGLMNEPVKQTAAEWRSIMDAVVVEIRNKGATNLILVPGRGWDGAHSWFSTGNAAAFETFVDPGNNFAFEAHQ